MWQFYTEGSYTYRPHSPETRVAIKCPAHLDFVVNCTYISGSGLPLAENFPRVPRVIYLIFSATKY